MILEKNETSKEDDVERFYESAPERQPSHQRIQSKDGYPEVYAYS